MNLHSTLVGALFAMPLMAQGLVLLEGPSTASLDVRVIEEAQLATSAGSLLLQGIEILPIEITGRRASQELDGACARVDTRNGIRRVELPGVGRLLAYRRQGGAFWGYLLAPLLGGARVVLELPGVGSSGISSPFADRIGVAQDGRHAVIPLRGGITNHVVRLDGGTLGNGANSRIVTIPGGSDNTSIMVGSTVAFATGNDRIFRFPLAAGNATDLTPTIAPTNPRLKPELAMSGDGNKVVFLYGGSNLTLQLFLLDASAPAAVLLPPPPGKYEEPGYLPEESGNLHLMLNDDGSRLFYYDSIALSNGDESYLLDTTGALPTLQITSDAHFQPTIGIHILPSFKGTSLMTSIGNTNQMDWFKADLTAAGGTVVNLTGTGSVISPFPTGTLIPSKVKIVGTTAFATDVTATTQTLRSLDLNAASSQVLFQDLPENLAIGSALAIVPDLYVPGAGDRIYSGLTGNLIGATPAGLRISPPLTTPFFGVTSVSLLPNWGLVTFYAAIGGVFFGPLIQNLEQMVLTPGGGMLISSPTELLYLSLGRPQLTVPIPHQPVRVFLTGANG